MTRSEQRVEVVPGPFEARISRRGPRGVRVAVSGELDLAMAPELDDALRRAMAIADDIVIDLSAVKFIGSTLSPQVTRWFEIVGMAPTLPLVDV